MVFVRLKIDHEVKQIFYLEIQCVAGQLFFCSVFQRLSGKLELSHYRKSNNLKLIHYLQAHHHYVKPEILNFTFHFFVTPKPTLWL